MSEGFLPEIDPERCVHGLSAAARCGACVAACPRGALVLTQDGLGFIEENCDGCGLCAGACPQAAISAPETFAPRDAAGGPAIFVGCVETKTGAGCAHALGLRELARAADQGARRLVLAEAPCGACPRAAAAVPIEDSLAALNRLLESRGRAPMRLERRAPEAWAKLRAAAPSLGDGMSRRAFFRAAAAPAPAADPARIRLSEGGLEAVAPVLDAGLCAACDACARVCPHGAILDEGEGYAVAPGACVGCGLCVDVCEAKAVTLKRLTPAPEPLKLKAYQCRACGAPFRRAAAKGDPPQGFCPICARTAHARNLFQTF